MKTCLFFCSIMLFATPSLKAGIFYSASINDVNHRGAHELAGSLGVICQGNDFQGASPETPIYMEYYFGKGSVLAHTLVDLSSDDTEMNRPIFLPLFFDVDANSAGLSIAAPPEAISVVRWVKGENTIWLRIQSGSETWVRDGEGVLGPPTHDSGVFWGLGLSARTYAEALAELSVNLPFASRNPNVLAHEYHEAVSTLFCLDLTQSSLAASGIDSALPYDCFFSDHTSEVSTGIFVRNIELNIPDSGDFRIARGQNWGIFASPAANNTEFSPCEASTATVTSRMSLGIYQDKRVAPYSKIHDGSVITLQTPHNSGYGFNASAAVFVSDFNAPGFLEVDAASAFNLNGEALYHKVQLTWNGGSQQLNLSDISIDATLHYACEESPSDMFIEYNLQMADYAPPEDDAPFDGPHQQKDCGQTSIPTTSGVWRHSALPETGMVPHVTQADQGFKTHIIMANTSQATQYYELYPYTNDGLALPLATGQIDGDKTEIWSSQQLFGTDQVSHFRFQTPQSVVITTVYQANRHETGPAHVGGLGVSSQRWRIYPGNSQVTWDGMAVVNRGDVPTQISVVQYNETGQAINQSTVHGALAPMAKQLMVLSQEFQPIPGSYYEVMATLPISITSLRGDLNNNFLWQNSAIPLQ